MLPLNFIIIKLKTKTRNRIKSYKKGYLYVQNISWPMGFQIYEEANLESSKEIFLCFCIVGVVLFMMVQICVSGKPLPAEKLDQLPSIKNLKNRIINGKTGLIVSAAIGLSIAVPYAIEDLSKNDNFADNAIAIVTNMVDSYKSNIKRSKPSKATWLPYANGEMGAVKGQLLSCPTSNCQLLNISGLEATSYGIAEALSRLGFEDNVLSKYGVNVELVRNEIRNILAQENGMPVEKIVYNESKAISSKIESEIIGDLIVRNEIESSLKKGVEPSSPINRNFLVKHLNKYELFSYDIAIRTGDNNMAKTLTNKAMIRSKSEEIE